MNKVLTAIDKSGSFRVYLTVSTELVEEARRIHETTPTATAALGRVLTGAGLMGLMLKNENDKLTVIFKGDGPAQQILATADGKGNVKGYIANPSADLPLKENGKLDVGGCIGAGELTVIKDMGLKEPYVGTVALVSGEIAEDLTAYYYISEQQNSAIALGVKVDRDYTVACAGGMIVQLLPDAAEEAVEALENVIGKMPPITSLIDRVSESRPEAGQASSFEAGQANSPEAKQEETLRLLMQEIFAGLPADFALEALESKNIDWQCDCSEERLEKVLMTIGKKDLQDIIEEDGKAELVCQFCLKKYNFDKAHLEKILASVS